MSGIGAWATGLSASLWPCTWRWASAERVPLSGAAGGSYGGDLIVTGMRCEVKARRSGEGFKQLEAWLGENDVLFLRRNHAEPLIVLWRTWARLSKTSVG